jgi:hypothetical protein
MYEFDSTGALMCANKPSEVIEKDYVAIKVKAVQKATRKMKHRFVITVDPTA